MGGWIISKTEQFESATTSAREAIRAELRSCAKGVKGAQAKAKKSLQKLKALRKFLQAVGQVEACKIDPAKLKRAVDENGKPIPNIHVLKRGDWTGYYRIDVAAKSATGMIALEARTEAERIEALLKALG